MSRGRLAQAAVPLIATMDAPCIEPPSVATADESLADPLPTATTSAPPLVGLPPVVDARARVVVLGSFPGVASLRAAQYYAHPRNHFWPIVSRLLGVDLVAMPYDERLERLLDGGVGLWDVYASCRRDGSLDSAIEAAEFTDLRRIAEAAPDLAAFLHNGGESARSMLRISALGVAALRLPSTSPANASWSFERKLAAWREAFERFGVAVR